MPYFKDTKNNVHFLEDAIFSYLLPDGCVEITDTEAKALVMPTDDDELIAQYTIAIQQRLDNFARTRNYDSILSATTYATSSIPKFKAEGKCAVELRGATWAKCYEILEDVESGARTMPALDELLSELPALSWGT